LPPDIQAWATNGSRPLNSHERQIVLDTIAQLRASGRNEEADQLQAMLDAGNIRFTPNDQFPAVTVVDNVNGVPTVRIYLSPLFFRARTYNGPWAKKMWRALVLFHELGHVQQLIGASPMPPNMKQRELAVL
jgi:hypothetical protein